MLSVSGCDPSPALEVQERIFHEVAHFVEIFVIFALFFAILFGRYFGLHSLLDRLFYNGIRIVSFVSQQMLGADSIDQCDSLCAICNGTCCNNDSDRQTIRIHGQMYLGIEPPFVRLMS